MAKKFMLLDDGNMADLNAGPATGMNFYIVEGPSGFLAVYENGIAMPFYRDPIYYCVEDLLSGLAVPSSSLPPTSLNLIRRYSKRSSATAALQAFVTYPAYTGRAWAFPRVATVKLDESTEFYRFSISKRDPRFDKNLNQLLKGTYLTSIADFRLATSGFGVVGRYALPIPISAHYWFKYELPKDTIIDVGTVAPNFGQSGGGVEVCLQNHISAKLIDDDKLPEY